MAANDTDGKPASPAVSVIVLAYESGALLTECLASLERQTIPVSYTHLTLPTIYSV